MNFMGKGIGQFVKMLNLDKAMPKIFHEFAKEADVDPHDIDIIMRMVDGNVNVFIYCKKTGKTLRRLDIAGLFEALGGSKKAPPIDVESEEVD